MITAALWPRRGALRLTLRQPRHTALGGKSGACLMAGLSTLALTGTQIRTAASP